MLRKKSGRKRVEKTGNWRRLDSIMRSLMICTSHRIQPGGDQIGKISWARYVARMGDRRDACRVLVVGI